MELLQALSVSCLTNCLLYSLLILHDNDLKHPLSEIMFKWNGRHVWGEVEFIWIFSLKQRYRHFNLTVNVTFSPLLLLCTLLSSPLLPPSSLSSSPLFEHDYILWVCAALFTQLPLSRWQNIMLSVTLSTRIFQDLSLSISLSLTHTPTHTNSSVSHLFCSVSSSRWTLSIELNEPVIF